MCRLKSCLVLKNRVFCPPYDSHDQMLEELNIGDDEINAMKVFVRAELVPPMPQENETLYGGEFFARLFSPLSEWKLVVDQDLLPDWWEPAIYRLAIEQAVQEWRDKYVLFEQKEKSICGNGLQERYYFYKCHDLTLTNVFAVLSNCRNIDCDGGNLTTAFNSTLTSGASSDIEYNIYGNSFINSHNESPVWAFGKAIVNSYVGNIYLRDESTCIAYGDTSVFAHSDSKVFASGSSLVRAYGRTALSLAEDSTAIVFSPGVKYKTIGSAATVIKKFDN